MNYLVRTLLNLPWLIFIVVWNFKFPNATPIHDVLATVCLFLFNKSFTQRLEDPYAK